MEARAAAGRLGELSAWVDGRRVAGTRFGLFPPGEEEILAAVRRALGR